MIAVAMFATAPVRSTALYGVSFPFVDRQQTAHSKLVPAYQEEVFLFSFSALYLIPVLLAHDSIEYTLTGPQVPYLLPFAIGDCPIRNVLSMYHEMPVVLTAQLLRPFGFPAL